MKRIINVLIIILTGFSLMSGQTANRRANQIVVVKQQSGNSQEEVQQLDDKLREALLKRDIAALECIYSEDFTATSSAGEVKDKAQVIKQFKSGGAKYEMIALDAVTVRAYGETATLTGLMTIKGTRSNNQSFDHQNRIIRVYVKQQGQWRLVAQQSTRIAAPKKQQSIQTQPEPELTQYSAHNENIRQLTRPQPAEEREQPQQEEEPALNATPEEIESLPKQPSERELSPPQ